MIEIVWRVFVQWIWDIFENRVEALEIAIDERGSTKNDYKFNINYDHASNR